MQPKIYEVIDVDADDSGVTAQEPANIEKQSVFIDLTLDDEPSDDGSRARSATLYQPAERAALKRASSSASQAAPPMKRRKEQAMESVATPAHKPSSKRPHSNAPHELSDERDLDYSDGEPPIKRSRRQGCHVEANRSTLERTSSSRVKDVIMIEYNVSTEDEEENSSSVVADYASADDASDSEREYETLYDALNPKMEKNWLPLKPHLSPRPLRKRDEDLLALNLAAMTVSPSSDNLVKERKKGQVHGFRLPPDLLSLERGRNAYRGSSFVWTETSALPRRYQLSNSSFKLLRGLHASRVAHASGSVVKIVQHGPMVAIASAVLGGSGNDETDRLNRQYNQAGSLMLWSNGKGYTLHAHRRPWTEKGALSMHTPRISNYLQTDSGLLHSNVVLHSPMQYMTTEDVQFNPLQPMRMASCGADGIVQLWDCDQIVEDNMLLPVRAVPLDNCKAKALAYKPDGCALAVSAFDGNIYVQQDSAERSSSITLPLGPDANQTTTDMIWGRKSSSHILYASSASCSIQEMAGCHKAFDVNSGDVICELDAQEAGQRLAVNVIGDTVVLATQGPGMSFCLRKYDARRRLGRAVARTMLEPFTGEGSHKVNYMAFSPDGVYIAIARTDNTAHVYDARFLGKDVLHVFAHEDGSTTQGGRRGVITAQWVDGYQSGLGLVTGGADGCVRLWDVRRSTDDPFNGNPIAECDYGISDFAMGDIRKGEHPLIVGECSGQVNVFR